MLRKTCLVVAFSLLLALVGAGTFPAAAQPYFADECNDEAVRQEFIADVKAGATEEELELKYGGCRDYVEPNQCTVTSAVQTADIRSIGAATKTVLNSNIFYERLNGCGYHPQAEMASCDVELRRTFGFGGFPAGSTEWVRFCLDCTGNGVWNYTTTGFVHVTNDISGFTPSYFFEAHATTFDAPAACTNNNGGAGVFRAILSWVLKPATCNSRPFWGNTITETFRRDP